jgi:hypothetical protein
MYRLLRCLMLGLAVFSGAALAQSYPDKSKPLPYIPRSERVKKVN